MYRGGGVSQKRQGERCFSVDKNMAYPLMSIPNAPEVKVNPPSVAGRPPWLVATLQAPGTRRGVVESARYVP